MKTSRYLAGAIAIFGALTLTACAASGGGGGSGPVGIGEIGAYTGDQAFEAQFSACIDYPALYALNKAGGILGRKVSLIPIDTRSDPADALAAVNKAIATNPNLSAVMGPDSTSASTLVPLLDQRHIPMVLSAGNAAYDRSNYAYMWRDVPPDAANAVAIALWAQKQGYQHVATVFATDTGSQGDLAPVLSALKVIGIQTVDSENLTPDQPSYRSSVSKVLSVKPDVIITESDGPTAASFFGELKQLGSLVPIIGTSATPAGAYFDPMRGAIGSGDFNKYFRAVVTGTPSTNLAVKTYNAAVVAVGDKLAKPVDQWKDASFCESGYDGMISMALAMDAANSTSGSTFNSFIMKVTKPGSGKTVVYTYADGLAALKAGHQIQYIGASGPLLFDKFHNSFGDQAVQQFPVNAPPVTVGVITQAQVQAVGGQ